MTEEIFKPIYIWRPVLDPEPIRRLAAELGLAPDDWDPHVTVASSSRPVNWGIEAFLPEAGAVVIRPQRCPALRFGRDREFLSIVLDLPDIRDRHYALRKVGADYAYEVFRPHLTLGRAMRPDLPSMVCLEEPIRLGPEERKIAIDQAATA